MPSPQVLHVVENLDRGAVENWLVRMLEHARCRRVSVEWTFYCVLGQPGRLDQKARALGAHVILSTAPLGNKVDFVMTLRRELLRGRYDVLHCHHDIVSAMYLLSAMATPIGRRIVHVHNADENVPTGSALRRRLYREPMRQACLAMADCIVGISDHTLDTFLAGRCRREGRDIVHYYGVDTMPFENVAADRGAFRRGRQLPADALILLFAGRLVPEKNPVFAVDVLANLLRVEPRAVGIFAGTGSLESEVVARAQELGIIESVRMLGFRKDLPEIMSCSDWFILPHPDHPMEGFGLAVVEAQLAGLRMLLSTGIPDDPLLPTASFRRMPLSTGPAYWAAAAIGLLQLPPPSRDDALAALRESPMNMDRALEGLLGLYQ